MHQEQCQGWDRGLIYYHLTFFEAVHLYLFLLTFKNTLQHSRCSLQLQVIHTYRTRFYSSSSHTFQIVLPCFFFFVDNLNKQRRASEQTAYLLEFMWHPHKMVAKDAVQSCGFTHLCRANLKYKWCMVGLCNILVSLMPNICSCFISCHQPSSPSWAQGAALALFATSKIYFHFKSSITSKPNTLLSVQHITKTLPWARVQAFRMHTFCMCPCFLSFHISLLFITMQGKLHLYSPTAAEPRKIFYWTVQSSLSSWLTDRRKKLSLALMKISENI